jgi:hypothetical protein
VFHLARKEIYLIRTGLRHRLTLRLLRLAVLAQLMAVRYVLVLACRCQGEHSAKRLKALSESRGIRWLIKIECDSELGKDI